MNKNPQPSQRYYCIRLANKKDIYAFADHADVKDGAIILRGNNEEIGLAVAAGGWEYCFEASYHDGSPLQVEHWLEERRYQAPHRKNRVEQRLTAVEDTPRTIGPHRSE